MDWLALLFDSSGFPPRWSCGTWTSLHGWVHIVSDIGIWSAYTAIPVILLYFIRRRPGVGFNRLFWLFSAFILCCGTTHLLEAIIFWTPVYRFAGLLKVTTAVVSWATVLALVPAIPRAMRYRSPDVLEAEVQERTKMLEAARREADAFAANLRRKNREMERLVYAVSHDLRSPLVTVLGYVEVLEEELEQTENSEVRRALTAMRGSGGRLSRRIDDLLTVSRLGRLSLEFSPIQLEAVATTVEEDLHQLLKDRGVTLKIGDDLPALTADGRRLGQALQNLVKNAVVHGQAKNIEITAEPRDGGHRIWVRDDGVGIPEDLQIRIFGLFERGPTEADGTGIGLAIVDRVARLHGGSTGVESSVGAGAGFWVWLPLEPDPPTELELL